ncbi:hypothetical protein GTW51_01640 [Aurantimonas aggregata]|uniref:Uncharacterized protein n=1 Tax=Aurantimonas aggregata TaxID=2047720 RepID=A0A6L9MCK5_9HYPH|nr:hypothetical protein [Aurantimonas aggregata]NDV85398.1 hypothetical protein [Aurantimonas aggregata]
MTAFQSPSVPNPRRSSALRQSASQRLTLAAIPIVFLWLAVAFALDLFA